MKRLIYTLIICAAIIAGLTATAQHSWRGKLRPDKNQAETVSGRPMLPADSLKILVSGFEKTLRSNIETFYITNLTDSIISEIKVTLNYTDIHGRQLHQRTERRATDIPPGQTRLITLKALDRQSTLYYYKSTPPRTSSNATPFMVTVRVDSIL